MLHFFLCDHLTNNSMVEKFMKKWNVKRGDILITGGVEDTSLEAKAKDTKKSEAKDILFEDRPSRGQGQECLRPRPRTKDTDARVLPKKKKVFKKFFRQSPIYMRSQNFRLRRPKPQLTCNDVIKNLPVGT